MATFNGSNADDEFSIFGNSGGIVSDPPGLTALTNDGDLIFGNGGDDSVYAGDGAVTVHGGDGDDFYFGGLWSLDRVFGDAGRDRITVALNLDGAYADGGAGNDRISATRGDATLIGGYGWDSLSGGVGDELLIGGAGSDLLRGWQGMDLLRGGAGDDVLFGGDSGVRDTLIGGAGADAFRPGANYDDAVEENTGAFLIRAEYNSAVPAFEGAGQAGGDSIDLHFFDADRSTYAHEAFIFGGQGGGHVWLDEKGTQTLVLMNTDSDAQTEFRIAIDDGAVRASDYTVDDFILV